MGLILKQKGDVLVPVLTLNEDEGYIIHIEYWKHIDLD